MRVTFKTRLEALWLVPLGLLSFLLFRAARLVLAKLIERQTFRRRSYKPGWRPMSGPMLQLKWYLPWIMTRAPRWNPHALIANAGPFNASRHIRVCVRDADQAAGDWTIVLYSHPHYRTLKALARSPGPDAPQWVELDVGPGQYTLSLRYYHLQAAPMAPAIEVDGQPFFASAPLQQDTNDFYHTLAERSNAFYRALQFYIYVLLRFERRVAPAFLRREFLPAGNPSTLFVYGYHRAGQRVRVELAPALFERCYAYLTLYERSSFPIAWHDLDAPILLSAAAPQSGYYLLRVCPKPGQVLAEPLDGVRVAADYPPQTGAQGKEDVVLQ